MRGSLKQRSPGSWTLIIDRGYVADPVTGKSKRRQQWITMRGSKRDAQTRLNDILSEHQRGAFIAPNKRTVGAWLNEWCDKAIKPPRRTAGSYDRYKTVIRLHLMPELGHIRLQELQADDIERYYAVKEHLAPATVEQHHVILHGALEAAVRAQLVVRNVAKLVTGKPHAPAGHQHAMAHCWTGEDAACFLDAAKAFGPLWSAFFALALDSGARKAELCGLKWSDLDVAQGRLRIERQLLTVTPVSFGPVKGKRPRVVDIAPETVTLLLAHKSCQARIKMRNRQQYHDHGLMFAKEWAGMLHGRDGKRTLGAPLQMNNLGQREYAQIIAAAKVRPIKFHGLRHTCASLLLSAGVPAKVVQERLGHMQITTTLDTYAHVLPSMQRDAARQLAAILHRS